MKFDDLFRRGRRLPLILSAEAAECGLSSMAMILAYHGKDIGLNALRQRFPVSLNGLNLRDLLSVAEQVGLAGRALRIELDDLPYVRTPAILHWDLNHFVVLSRADARNILIHDPALGERRISLAEAGKHFTGIVLELDPAPDFASARERQSMSVWHLWSNSLGLPTAISQVLGLSAALQVLAFVSPFFVQLAVDQAIASSDTALLNTLALGFGAIAILYVLTESLRAWSVQYFTNLISFQTTSNLFHHLLRLPTAYFEKRHIGDLLSRMESGDAIQQSISQGVITAIIDGGIALVALVVMLLYSAQLTAVVGLSLAIDLGFILATYGVVRRRTSERLVASADERSYLIESVRAIATIKLMGREDVRESVWSNRFVRVVNAGVSIARWKIATDSVLSATKALSVILIIYLASRMVIAGDGFSVGMLLAFLSFQQIFHDRTQSLVNHGAEFRLLGLHLDRLSDIVFAEPEPITAIGAIGDIRGRIELRGVSFRYSATEPWILKDVDIEIAPGEFVAIVGPSGGGKSTLFKLLLGLYPPTRGEILLDGQVATPALWRAWRSQVGAVAQDDHLLSGSIADNIAYSDPELDMGRVHRAAERARIHADISRMPMRYLSLVGDMGSALSGGQKQRLLLARALYRDPRFLILDEGTANLDPAVEEEISELISELEMTRVVIAHRPALVRRADRVITVDRGAGVSSGPNPGWTVPQSSQPSIVEDSRSNSI